MELSFDRPAPGLVIAQPKRGFRYGAEAFWLAGAVASSRSPGTVLDLGTGSGVIAALLARLGWDARGVDVQDAWAPAWAESLARCDVPVPSLARTDVVDLPPSDHDVVVSNPPFFRADEGPVSADRFRATARTESTATLAAFVAAAERSMSAEGVAWFVVPREREVALLAAADGAGLIGRALVRVGARRTVARFDRTGLQQPTREVGEDDELPRAWYAAATAVP